MTDNKQTTDNGGTTVIADENATDNRHIANGKALAIVKAVIKAEDALSITAKEHGLALFRSVYQDGNNLDMLIGENKLAAGYATLSTSDSGKKAKQKLDVYFSNYRFLAERWAGLSDDVRNAILDGTNSVHYVVATIRKAENDAKREAAKLEAEKANAVAVETPAETLESKVRGVIAAYQEADEEARNAAFDALTELFALVDADTVAQGEAETSEPVAIAA